MAEAVPINLDKVPGHEHVSRSQGEFQSRKVYPGGQQKRARHKNRIDQNQQKNPDQAQSESHLPLYGCSGHSNPKCYHAAHNIKGKLHPIFES